MPDATPADPHPDYLFRTVMDHAPDAVIWADAQGIICYWNLGAEELFGSPASVALGQTMDFIIPENLRARHWEGYHRVMAGEPSRYGRAELLKVPALYADGSRKSIEFTLDMLDDPIHGRIAVAYLRDASETFNEMRALRKELALLKAEQARATEPASS